MQADCLLAAGVLVTALVPSLTACLASSPGSKRRTAVWISRLVMVERLFVVGQSGSFSGDSLKDIVDEAVHDRHGLATDASVGVHLFQHLVDVDGIAFLPFPLAFLVARANSLCLAGFLGTLES